MELIYVVLHLTNRKQKLSSYQEFRGTLLSMSRLTQGWKVIATFDTGLSEAKFLEREYPDQKWLASYLINSSGTKSDVN